MRTTTEDFAKRFQIDPSAARGMLEFLTATGLATKGKAEKVPGERGRAKALYSLSGAAQDLLSTVEAERKALAVTDAGDHDAAEAFDAYENAKVAV